MDGVFMNELIEILVQFGGDKGGGPGNVAVRFLLPTFFWCALTGVAFRQWRRTSENKDLYVGIAASMGMARELLMFTAEYGAWRNMVPFEFMYNYYPPLEHAATMLSCIFIGYAFLNYQLKCRRFSRLFVVGATTITLMLYVVTAVAWHDFQARNAGAPFGTFWGDMVFRTTASVFMGLVLGTFIHAAARGKKVSTALMCGFTFLFLDEFLMIINLLSNERHIDIYAPIRHNLHIWAIPQFLWTYWADLSKRMCEAEQVIKSVFNLSPGMLCLIDFEGAFRVVSPASSQVLGIPPEELTGRRLTEFGFEVRRDGNLSFVSEDGIMEPLQFEKKYLPANGPGRWLHWNLQPVAKENIFYAVVSDVTEQKALAEELLEERNKLDAIISCLGDGLSIQDTDYRIVYQNQIHKNMLGDHVGEYCYRGYGSDARVCPDCPVADAFLDLQVHHAVRTVKQGDDAKYVEIAASPLKDGSGAVIGAIELVRDITARKEAEEEIRRLNSDLERRVTERTARLTEACRELESFSFSVSHDLRSPLRSICGYSEQLLEDYGENLDDQGRLYVENILNGGRRMAQIIEAMLDFSTISRNELHRENVDLSELAVVVMAELRLSDPERMVSFTISKGLVVNGDARLLRSVMENLFGNAWKYSGNVPHSCIEFGKMEEGGASVFFVRDNGAGFDMAHSGKLFAPFQRLHLEREFPGNGIGLATVQRIIQRHGGRIWAESAPARGATFYFTL